MIEKSGDLWSQITTVASQVIGWCAQEILTVDALREQMMQEWRVREGEDQPSQRLLTRMALRICSSALCEAWRSAQPDIRNRACDNLRRYLNRFLQNSNYAQSLWQDVHATEDILQEVLEELYVAVRRNPRAGPDDPASFLKYAQVATLHHAYAYVQKSRQQIYCLSLEDMEEYQHEECVEILMEKREHNPQRYAEHNELQQILKDVILTLRNRRYREVLLYTYLAGMEESELASYLEVSVQEIYMWRHRALQALRNKSEIIEVLRLYRE